MSDFFVFERVEGKHLIAGCNLKNVVIRGAVDLRNMFRDLEHRVSNPLDDGRVEGNMSLADKASLEAVDRKTSEEGSGRE